MYCKRLYHETWYLVISILKPWVSCATDSFTHIVTVCSFIIFRSSNSCIVNNSTIKPGIRRHRYLSLVIFNRFFHEYCDRFVFDHSTDVPNGQASKELLALCYVVSTITASPSICASVYGR